MNPVEVPPAPGATEPLREGWGRALFEVSDDAIVVHDLEGHILDANPAACRRLGYPREELVRRTTSAIDEPEFAATFRERVQTLLAERHSLCQGRHVTRDGHIIPVSLNSSLVEYNGQPAVLAVIRDLSQRQRAEETLSQQTRLLKSVLDQRQRTEETLRKQTRLLQSILDHMGDGVIVADENERFLVFNPAAERMFGLGSTDTTSSRWAAQYGLYLPDMETPFPTPELPLMRAIRGQDVNEVEMFVRHAKVPEGNWVSITGRPLRDEAGQIRGGVVVCRDVTERKRAERRLTARTVVTRALAEAATLAEAAPQILRGVCECVSWDMGAFWAVDRAAGVMRCIDLWLAPGVHLPRFEAMTREAAFPPGTGLPGKVWAAGQPVWLVEIGPDPSLPRAAALAADGLHATFAVPVRSGNQVTGALEFFSRRPRPVEDDLLGLMTDLGIQIGQFIDRQHNHEEVARVTRFLDSIVENIPAMLFVKEADGLRFERINKAEEKVLGYRREDLIGKSDYDLFPREQADFFTRKDREVLQSGRLLDITEEQILTRDGLRIFHTRKMPILDDQGKPRYLLGISEDITERKALEETRRQYAEARERHAHELEAKNQALQDSQALYHSLVECLPQNIYRKDRDGRFTFANQRCCAAFGRPLEQILGRTDLDLVPERRARYFREQDRRVLETGQPLEEIDVRLRPDGSRQYFQIVKTPVRDAQGEVIGTQGIFWDVTETRRAQEAVAESERRYRQVTESSLDAIVVADEQQRITLFNPAAERAFGYRAAEVLGQPLETLMPAEFRDQHRQGFRRYLTTRVPRIVGRTVELRGRRKDGTDFPLELSLSALDLGGELQFLGAIRDLTERYRMRSIVVQTEKLASIGLLSAGVAHEINNPLAYVANNLVVLERDLRGLMALLAVYDQAQGDLARVRPDLADQARALAEDMDLPYVRDNLDRLLTRTREGVLRVTKIVRSLSSLARTAPPQLQEASIPDLVESSLEIIRGQLRRRGIEVEQRYDDPGKVRCVVTQLSQVLLNLLVNAMHAIEAREGGPPGRIVVSTHRAADELVIEVADNGCGIDSKDLPRLFDPFFTTKPVGEGTGLGLSISHNIVTGHGGRIEVDSRRGEGSRFCVFLPLDPHLRKEGA
jgi:PAS domain S-box-containing protein